MESPTSSQSSCAVQHQYASIIVTSLVQGFDPFKDGAACCIIASEDFVHQHELENQAIEIVGNALATDSVETFETRRAMDIVGFAMTQRCADEVFSQGGFPQGEGRDQVAVIELHDCFATNEVSFLRYLRAVLTDY